MAAKIWFAVFIGVLSGGASAYRLFGTFWHFGVLAGILIGMAISLISLAPVRFWREFVNQLAKVDESFHGWQEARRKRRLEIAHMRRTWIEGMPDILKIMFASKVLGVEFLVTRGLATMEAIACLSLFAFGMLAGIPTTKWLASGITILIVFEALWSLWILMLVGFFWAEDPRLIPSYWEPLTWTTKVGFILSHQEAIQFLATHDPGEYLRKMLWRAPIYLVAAWWLFVVWPGAKWLWRMGPNMLRALWHTFRYVHSDAHRHVMTHTALGIAVSVWGFNAPVLPAAAICATASTLLWFTVSRRVFQPT